MLGLSSIFLFNLIFNVNSNLAESNANSSVVQLQLYNFNWTLPFALNDPEM